jgi:AcrR family transcriptional regulator
VTAAPIPSSPSAAPAASPGRPRRFSADEEIERIFTAAFEVLRRNDYQDVTVADILTEAGMSTRSFYRHFSAKDQLVCALYRRDADRAAARLEQRVRAAGNPRAALEAWTDEILSFGQSSAKAHRVATLGSWAAARAEGSEAEGRRAMQSLVAPLRKVLDAGLADGSFPLASPARDARMISAVVCDAAGLAIPGPARRPLADARSSVLSFCLRALGATDC